MLGLCRAAALLTGAIPDLFGWRWASIVTGTISTPSESPGFWSSKVFSVIFIALARCAALIFVAEPQLPKSRRLPGLDGSRGVELLHSHAAREDRLANNLARGDGAKSLFGTFKRKTVRYMSMYITRRRPAEQGFQIALGGLGIATAEFPGSNAGDGRAFDQ